MTPPSFLLARFVAPPYHEPSSSPEGEESPVSELTNTQPDYEAPHVQDYGDLVELTAGAADGESLDASFPVATPKRDLTFS